MALAWHFEDEHAGGSLDLLDRVSTEPVVVPRHWFAEVANGALVGERRKRSTPAQMPLLINLLRQLDLEVDEEGMESIFDRIVPLARTHALTVYDALYLELAERRGLPLATLDKDLAGAALRRGFEVLGPLGA